jgi:ABC-type nitrate/sulfonate/bicarbonate transport system permease component
MSALSVSAIERLDRGRESIQSLLWPVISIAVLVLVWWLISLGIGNPVIVPSPAAVAQRAFSLAQAGELGDDVATSLGHLLVGYVIGGFLGMAIGFAMAMSTGLRGALRVTLDLLRPIPPLAWIPAALLVVGFGPQLPIALIGYSAFFPFWINTMAGVRQLPRPLSEVSRTLGASTLMFWREVATPAAMPSILAGARIALGLAWMTIVAAELVGGTSGLGFLIMKSLNYLDSAGIIAGMLVIAALSFTMDRFLRALSHRLCPWMVDASW